MTKIDQKLTKFSDKKVSKITILNVKIDIFTKIHSIWLKSDKKWSKIDTYLWHEIEVKFDYQKGG